MDTCYLFGAGEISGLTEPPKGYIIAADGGYDGLRRLGIVPNLIIGDLDSLQGDLPDGVEIIRHPIRKDYTDMHLAYLEGAKRGFTDFEIYGGTGGASDHTFANYCLLLYGKRQGHTLRLRDELSTARVIENEKITLHGVLGHRLSVFAIGGEAQGVSIKGAEYEADDVTLSPEFPLGVSNAFTGRDVTLRVRQGALLIITEN